MGGSSVVPQLWLRPHQDSRLHTDHAAPRQSNRVQQPLHSKPTSLQHGERAGSEPGQALVPAAPGPFPPPPRRRARPLTALLLITLVEAVGQPVTLPGAGDAPAIAAHEVARNVALVGEVVPREQLALCRREGTGRSDGQRRQGATSPPLNGLLFDAGHVRETSGMRPDFPGPQFPHL